MAFLKLLALTFVALGHMSTVQSQINYFGVGFSPYVRTSDSLWNSYSLEEIKKMLYITLTYHNAISTYSMGVSERNNNQPWDQADSNCLIPRAAAQINRERNSVVLSVSQGIYQNGDPGLQNREIENAFSAAADANGIFPGSVWGLTFTNEFVISPENGQLVLNMIRDNKGRASQMGLKVGARIHTCGEIYGGPNQDIIKQIVRESDFIMCNIYPPPNSDNADRAVQAVSDGYYSARDGFLRENPNIDVQIGETGWASEGETFFNPPHLNTIEHQKNFWLKMKDWANSNQVKVQMFEAFDEPWKTGLPGEKKFGWWYRAYDNSPYYIEKSTGIRYE